jgi:hypothetical protein
VILVQNRRDSHFYSFSPSPFIEGEEGGGGGGRGAVVSLDHPRDKSDLSFIKREKGGEVTLDHQGGGNHFSFVNEKGRKRKSKRIIHSRPSRRRESSLLYE